ncbi:MAG: NAD(P)-binding domain-containing protein [Actinomycetia bacterium]|nr:NAD(P)-binding domain-containing protein [Actinomycetes bacterium]
MAEKILIVGTGTMGEGIAQTFAQNGFDVRFVARREEPLARAMEQIPQNVEQFIEFGLTEEGVDQVMARIEGMVTTDMAKAAEGCSYVVETIRENLEDKRALISAIQAVDPELVIGSNTGSMTVDSLAEGMPKPENIIGIHYFNPAHIIPLVEIHRGSRTSDAAYELTARMMRGSGKKTVLVRKEVPGFIVNRVMGAITREIHFILDQGICTPEDLDTAIKSSTGLRFACLGPMEVDDMIGLDISATVSARVFPGLSNATGPSELLLEKVKKGELGIKSGKGWYDYSGRTRAEVLEEKNRALLPQLKLFLEREKA